MSFTSSLAFFDHLMSEGAIDEAALIHFLSRSTSDEGLHLDFKTGLMFNPLPKNPKKGRGEESEDERKKRCAFVVRQYVAAFANSEGGVLAIGIKDQTRDEKQRGDPKSLEAITPAHEAGIGNDLKGWASRCVSELIGYLGVPPRFFTVDVAGGKVLLIAVARAPALVPIIKQGMQGYYFRVEDEAREVYPHLISDLVLGRRQTPKLTVHASLSVRRHPPTGKRRMSLWPSLAIQTDVLELDGGFVIANDSVLPAVAVSGGVVAFGVEPASSERAVLNGDLRARLALVPMREVAQTRYFHWPLTWPATDADDRRGNTITIRPFEVFRATPRRERQDWLSLDDKKHYWVALYLVPDRCEPIWFELGIQLGDRTWSEQAEPVEVTVDRMVGQRPRVGANNLSTSESR